MWGRGAAVRTLIFWQTAQACTEIKGKYECYSKYNASYKVSLERFGFRHPPRIATIIPTGTGITTYYTKIFRSTPRIPKRASPSAQPTPLYFGNLEETQPQRSAQTSSGFLRSPPGTTTMTSTLSAPLALPPPFFGCPILLPRRNGEQRTSVCPPSNTMLHDGKMSQVRRHCGPP